MTEFDLPINCTPDQYVAIVKTIKSNTVISDIMKASILEILEKQYAYLVVQQAISKHQYFSVDTDEWDVVAIDSDTYNLKRKKVKLASITEDDDDEIVLRAKRKHGDTFFQSF